MKKLDAIIIYYNSHPDHEAANVRTVRIRPNGISWNTYVVRSWDAVRLENLVNSDKYNVKAQVSEYWTKIIVTRVNHD